MDDSTRDPGAGPGVSGVPRLPLYLSVFLSGAVVMVYELVGSRVVAPALGSGLTVWTSLIGVILGALSLGYCLGGRLADRRPTSQTLAAALTSSGILILVTALIRDPVLGLPVNRDHLELHSVLVVGVLFAPASLALGCVLPLATRLALTSLGQAGRDLGGIYALSTAGSILGTFAAGFWLIPALGSGAILYLLAAIQVGTAIPLASRRWFPLLALLVVGMAGAWERSRPLPAGVLLDQDTAYSRLRVVRVHDGQGRPVNLLVDCPTGAQGASYLDSDELVFDCLRAFRLVNRFQSTPRRALLIGGGCFSYPKDFLAANPEATMDVVEIDPALPPLAQRFFRHHPDPRLRVFNQDGRLFLNRSPGPYDVVFLDAYRADDSTPPQLATVEALQRVREALVPQGVVLANLLGTPRGRGAALLRRQVAGFRRVFASVFVFQVDPARRATGPQNLTLVALKDVRAFVTLPGEVAGSERTLRALLIGRDDEPLTDDHAPVEYLARQR